MANEPRQHISTVSPAKHNDIINYQTKTTFQHQPQHQNQQQQLQYQFQSQTTHIPLSLS